MKHIIVLGSTGSIGKNALDIVRRNRDRFSVLGLSAHSNIDLLTKQINEFKPRYAVVSDLDKAQDSGLKANAALGKRSGRTKILKGSEGMENLVSKKSNVVVVGIGGSCALLPILKALDTTDSLALANKEALVMAGSIIMRQAEKKGVNIIPIDSEQSAIFQCIAAGAREFVKKIYLTASGGPFKNISPSKLKFVTPREALSHPRWKMGKKISVDSATLMNKGLELIEAMWLFDLKADEIEILIHRQSIIHSMVEFIDGAVLAQLAVADMRIPIQYSLTYPDRIDAGVKGLNFLKEENLTFEKPDYKKFPCLSLARKAAKTAGSAPCVLNAANEESVLAFLSGKISFIDIAKIIEKVLIKHRPVVNPELKEILKIDAWARDEVKCFIR